MKIITLEQACEIFNRYQYYYKVSRLDGKHCNPRWQVAEDTPEDLGSLGICLYIDSQNQDEESLHCLTKWEAITLAQALLDCDGKIDDQPKSLMEVLEENNLLGED